MSSVAKKLGPEVEKSRNLVTLFPGIIFCLNFHRKFQENTGACNKTVKL